MTKVMRSVKVNHQTNMTTLRFSGTVSEMKEFLDIEKAEDCEYCGGHGEIEIYYYDKDSGYPEASGNYTPCICQLD